MVDFGGSVPSWYDDVVEGVVGLSRQEQPMADAVEELAREALQVAANGPESLVVPSASESGDRCLSTQGWSGATRVWRRGGATETGRERTGIGGVHGEAVDRRDEGSSVPSRAARRQPQACLASPGQAIPSLDEPDEAGTRGS